MNQRFDYEALGSTLLIRLPKELDHHNCRNLKIETDLLLEENYIRRILFDFSDTRFMDSSGIGILLGRYKQMRAGGGACAYFGAGPQVRRILKMAGIPALMREFETREAALAAGR